jgi:hypothetical protein
MIFPLALMSKPITAPPTLAASRLTSSRPADRSQIVLKAHHHDDAR